MASKSLTMVKTREKEVAEKSQGIPRVIRVGCAGWSIPREAATHFPLEGSHLERYSRVFTCCEINSSFYKPHQPRTWERWAQSVPTGFRFSVKAPKAITHEARLHCDSDALSAFFEQISFLGNKLGPVLIQLPPSLLFDDVIAKRFFSMLRRQYAGDVVLEPRHSSWFDRAADELLKEFVIARAAADPACVPAAAQPGGSKQPAYFRLHGSPRLYYSAYSSDFLKELAMRLLVRATNSEAWCIFDNTTLGSATSNALELKDRLLLNPPDTLPKDES